MSERMDAVFAGRFDFDRPRIEGMRVFGVHSLTRLLQDGLARAAIVIARLSPTSRGVRDCLARVGPHVAADSVMERSRILAGPAERDAPAADQAADAHQTRERAPDELVTMYYREHAESVYRYLSGVYGYPLDAEDVTQEAFLKLYEALVAGLAIESPKAWVFTVARRLMLDRLKHFKYESDKRHAFSPAVAETIHDPAPTPEDALSGQRRRLALRGAIQRLSTTEKECLYARAQGLKLRQISEVVGLDLRRVAEIIGRAIQTLQRHVRG